VKFPQTQRFMATVIQAKPI